MSEPEYWLLGPVPDVMPLLQPVAHALLQARVDVTRIVAPLAADQLWTSAGRAASIGFHMKHLSGSLDRLLTYARGQALTPTQLAYLKLESTPGDPAAGAAALLASTNDAIDRALAQLRATPEHELLQPRAVGRLALPS